MKPREPSPSGQHDMFRSRLDQILDMGHEKVILADKIDWCFLPEKMGEVYTDGPGQPPLSNRLMAGLHILKYADNLSDAEGGPWPKAVQVIARSVLCGLHHVYDLAA